MIRLALETATDRLSVAAGHDDRIAERALDGARQHASALLPLVGEVLDEIGASRDGVGLVLLSDGPGSFTGLRVGAAVAKALVRTAGTRLLVASTLLVRAASRAQRGERVLAASNALRGEAYVGIWQFTEGGEILELMAPRPLDQDALADLPHVDRAVGELPPFLVAALEAQLGDAIESPVLPTARTLLDLHGRPGGVVAVHDPAGWEPDYGRPAEAQARWERAHGRPLPDTTREHG